MESLGGASQFSNTAAYARFLVSGDTDLSQLAASIESLDKDFEVVSMGHQLEIVKQTGSPDNLEKTYNVSRVKGTHGLGHTRLSTESRVDLSHSQPFWATGIRTWLSFTTATSPITINCAGSTSNVVFGFTRRTIRKS